MNFHKHPTLKVGDHVRCLKSLILFVDGTRHNQNDIFIVEDSPLSYYQLFTDNRNYEVVQ